MLRFFKSFGYAISGLRYGFKTQLNFRVHCIALIAVLILGCCTGLKAKEWMWICMASGLVIVTELVNTALEVLVDLVSPQYHVKAGIIKDLAAGAVLVAAITAIVIGLLIFIPKFCHVT